MDEAARLKLLQQIMARMMDNPPALYLVDFPSLIALSPRVKVAPSRVAGIEFENVELTE
jgi:hypothetical protein